MNEKQRRVRLCELDVRDAERLLTEARRDLERGYQKLKSDVDKAEIVLEREKAYLAEARTELEKGFSE